MGREGGLGFLVGFNGLGLTGQGETAPPTGGLVSIGDRQCHGRFGIKSRPLSCGAVWYYFGPSMGLAVWLFLKKNRIKCYF